jgi:hypothetical protein
MMAAGISPRNVITIVAGFLLAVLAFLFLAPHIFQQSAPPPECVPLPKNVVYLGPAQTVAEVERASLAEMARADPSVPRVPFGHQHARWRELKALAGPTDTVHEFRTEVSGGHLVLRGQCLVGQLAGWVR